MPENVTAFKGDEEGSDRKSIPSFGLTAGLIFLILKSRLLKGGAVRDHELDWLELTRLTDGQPFVVERVRLKAKGIAIEGAFAPPTLATLTIEDQVFVAAFLRAHGSIKEMEQVFGVSYPTIKARLNRIAARLDFVDTSPAPPRLEVLDRLARGEISPREAIEILEMRR